MPSASRTRLVLLGTCGGPVAVGGDRYGISTAVVHDGDVYLVDLGLGSLQRLAESGLGGGGGAALSRVRGIFFTHLHSDHVTDWPAAYTTASQNRRGHSGSPIVVRGPGRRSTLPRVFPPSRPEPPVFHPDDAAPGITGMTDRLSQAFAADFNERSRDSNYPHPGANFDIQDIDLTDVWEPTAEGVPPRLERPIPVWEDGEVRITATLVDHRPIAPAFAFRVDTPDGSVVISGDTAVSENLIEFARGADYLLHEVIDPVWVEQIAGTAPPESREAFRQHFLSAHTTIEQVGRDVAEPAGVKNLVLHHLVPAHTPPARWMEAQQGYSGRLVVGQDLQEFTVGG